MLLNLQQLYDILMSKGDRVLQNLISFRYEDAFNIVLRLTQNYTV
ncbi:MAG: hypothetical protein V7K32_17110 [Nostoc sp.]